MRVWIVWHVSEDCKEGRIETAFSSEKAAFRYMEYLYEVFDYVCRVDEVEVEDA